MRSSEPSASATCFAAAKPHTQRIASSPLQLTTEGNRSAGNFQIKCRRQHVWRGELQPGSGERDVPHEAIEGDAIAHSNASLKKRLFPRGFSVLEHGGSVPRLNKPSSWSALKRRFVEAPRPRTRKEDEQEDEAEEDHRISAV